MKTYQQQYFRFREGKEPACALSFSYATSNGQKARGVLWLMVRTTPLCLHPPGIHHQPPDIVSIVVDDNQIDETLTGGTAIGARETCVYRLIARLVTLNFKHCQWWRKVHLTPLNQIKFTKKLAQNFLHLSFGTWFFKIGLVGESGGLWYEWA